MIQATSLGMEGKGADPVLPTRRRLSGLSLFADIATFSNRCNPSFRSIAMVPER